MITKGLDFSGVTVVGILNADTMLNYPDFRAYEQAFQMLSQVSGRAGRRDERGLVILQTKSADLPVIQQVVAGDFKTFARDLLEERSMFRYPPFYHLVYVYLRHRNEQLVDSAAFASASGVRRPRARPRQTGCGTCEDRVDTQDCHQARAWHQPAARTPVHGRSTHAAAAGQALRSHDRVLRCRPKLIYLYIQAS